MKNNIRLIMAPLRSVTTSPFRRIYHNLFPFFDEAMAPFISASHKSKASHRLLRDLIPESTGHAIPLIPQILSNNPEHLPPFLDSLYTLGYRTVNWNLGCPAPMVTKKCKGSGLLTHPELIEPFLKELSADTRFTFSIKARLGTDNEHNFEKLLPLFERYYPQEIILHPRTAIMGYSGTANRDYFAQVLSKTDIPLVYNGDIFTQSQGEEILTRFSLKTSGIMLGRGILINPFLPALMNGESFPQDANIKIRSLIDSLFEYYAEHFSGSTPVLGKMKEYWKYLRFSFSGGDHLIKKIMKCTSVDVYQSNLEKLFTEIGVSEVVNPPYIDY